MRKVSEGGSRKDLGKDVCDIVFTGYEDEDEDAVGGLLAQPRHFHCEVSVATGNDVVFNHGDTSLIVLVWLRGPVARSRAR